MNLHQKYIVVRYIIPKLCEVLRLLCYMTVAHHIANPYVPVVEIDSSALVESSSDDDDVSEDIDAKVYELSRACKEFHVVSETPATFMHA